MTPGGPFTWLAERFDQGGDVGVLGAFLVDDALLGGDLPDDGLTQDRLVAHLRGRGATQTVLDAAPGALDAYLAEHPSRAPQSQGEPTGEHPDDTVVATAQEEAEIRRLEKRHFLKDGDPR